MKQIDPNHEIDRAWVEGLPGSALLDALVALHPNLVVLDPDGRPRFAAPTARADLERRSALSAWRWTPPPAAPTDPMPAGTGQLVVESSAPTETAAAHGARRARTIALLDEAGTCLGRIALLEADRSSSPAPGEVVFHGIRTRAPEMQKVFDTIRRVARAGVPVLVRGESGSGKELVARAIHAESPRAQRPFVAVNCAALTPSLMESELFGHKQGAFTGAIRDHKGLFEQAHRGTLFLDEVAELPLDMQAKLLRVLEEKRVTPVGAARSVAVDVRIVSATHRGLRTEVQAGRFREDLMYRLRVVPLFLPPLRARTGDIELLLHHFLRATPSIDGPIASVAPTALARLKAHPWPGNIRELRNVVEYAYAVGAQQRLELSDLPPEFHGRPTDGPAPGRPAPTDVDSSEAQAIRAALAATGGHVGQAAEALGISRPTLWRRRKRYGI